MIYASFHSYLAMTSPFQPASSKPVPTGLGALFTHIRRRCWEDCRDRSRTKVSVAGRSFIILGSGCVPLMRCDIKTIKTINHPQNCIELLHPCWFLLVAFTQNISFRFESWDAMVKPHALEDPSPRVECHCCAPTLFPASDSRGWLF